MIAQYGVNITKKVWIERILSSNNGNCGPLASIFPYPPSLFEKNNRMASLVSSDLITPLLIVFSLFADLFEKICNSENIQETFDMGSATSIHSLPPVFCPLLPPPSPPPSIPSSLFVPIISTSIYVPKSESSNL